MHPCHVNVYVAPSDNTQVTVSSKCGLSCIVLCSLTNCLVLNFSLILMYRKSILTSSLHEYLSFLFKSLSQLLVKMYLLNCFVYTSTKNVF